MNNAIVTYETFHGSAKKIAEVIAEKLGCKYINIDTPFEAEDLKNIDHIILVFNFRGPYSAQLTKLYLNRVKKQLTNTNVILVGEGLFSEKEFPVVAKEIYDHNPSRTFNTFFVKGQLRVATLYPEEKALLDKFSQITGMVIQDMGELDLKQAQEVAIEIDKLIHSEEFIVEKTEEKIHTKWLCPVCGYVHEGDTPPDRCPLCGVPASTFEEMK